jgi:3-hydroxy-D-aspartate aldolase
MIDNALIERKISASPPKADMPTAMLDAAARKAGITLPVYVEVNMGGNRCRVEPGEPALDLARHIAAAAHLAFAGLRAYYGSAQHLRGWEERRQAIAEAADKAERTRDVLARNGIECPTITGGGTGSFEFESVSGVYTELQRGSYIFMDADYGRNLDREGAPTKAFEPSLFAWGTVMSRPMEDRAIVDAGLKALAFDSGPPLVCDEPAAAYERASDEHGRLGISGATNRLRIGDKIRLVSGHCDPTSTFTSGTSPSAATASSNSGRSPQEGRCIDVNDHTVP